MLNYYFGSATVAPSNIDLELDIFSRALTIFPYWRISIGFKAGGCNTYTYKHWPNALLRAAFTEIVMYLAGEDTF